MILERFGVVKHEESRMVQFKCTAYSLPFTDLEKRIEPR